MSQYGMCRNCGAENLMSQKGKAYCSKKCWLNESQGASYRVAQTGMLKEQVTTKEDWKGIREEKADEIRANVALKMVSELIAAGKIDLGSWENWTNQFYNYSPVTPNTTIGQTPSQPTNRFQFNQTTNPALSNYGQEIDPATVPFN